MKNFAWSLILFSWVFHPALASQGSSSRTDPIFLRVGVSTFDGAESIADPDSHAAAVQTILAEVTRKFASKHGGQEKNGRDWRPLGFQIAVGNYYQIYEWLLSEEIDAAVVSAFTAELLARQDKTLAIAEFHNQWNKGGQCPVIAASDRGHSAAHPVRTYVKFLEDVWKEASASPRSLEDSVGRLRITYDVAFVAHFSSSGFIAPLLFAKSWLDTQQSSAISSRRFWKIFLNSTDFNLYHGNSNSRNPQAQVRIRFTYSGQKLQQIEMDNELFSEWYVYDPLEQQVIEPPVSIGRHQQHGVNSCGEIEPVIPNDRLVVLKSLPAETLDVMRGAVDLFAKYTCGTTGNGGCSSNPAYSSGAKLNSALSQRYSSAITQLFGSQSPFVLQPQFSGTFIRDKFELWYRHGEFRFRISETLDVLRQDAKIHGGRLALVLPGGGVKSIYQAAMLDHLYGRHGLRNARDAKPAAPEKTSDYLLDIHHIIGTSGGAMVGALAALQRGQIESSVRQAMERDVFPFWDLLRYASFVFSAAVLMGVVMLVRLLGAQFSQYDSWQKLHRDSRTRPARASAAVILAATPFLVRFVRAGEVSSISVLEGMLFAVVTLMCHAALVGASITPIPGNKLSIDRFRRVLWILTAAAYVAALFFNRAAEFSSATTACLLGSILALGALLVGPNKRQSPREFNFSESYPLCLLTVFMHVALSYALLAIFQFCGLTSSLELTSVFWLYLFGSSLAVSLSIVSLACAFGDKCRKLFCLVCVQGDAKFRYSFLGSLITISAVSIFLWGFFVTPAIYSSEDARDSFEKALQQAKLEDLQTSLVVTASELRAIKGATLEPARDSNPAGLYFCFGAKGQSCPQSGNMPFGYSIREDWKDAVLASGMPFPIFPPQRIQVNGRSLALVDGGYAHNVPLDAAWRLDSRRVLVVHSTPSGDKEPDEDNQFRFPVGQLVDYSNRIIPFLFDRAQEVDRLEARKMIVASLHPTGITEGEQFPTMTDFTTSAMDLIEGTAKEDISRDSRVGRIDSWGRPSLQDLIQVRVSQQPEPPHPESQWVPFLADLGLASFATGRLN